MVYDNITTDSMIIVYQYDMFVSENVVTLYDNGNLHWNGIIKPYHQPAIDIGEHIKSEYGIDFGIIPNYDKIKSESKP